jgi:hypothetical protein
MILALPACGDSPPDPAARGERAFHLDFLAPAARKYVSARHRAMPAAILLAVIFVLWILLPSWERAKHR